MCKGLHLDSPGDLEEAGAESRQPDHGIEVAEFLPGVLQEELADLIIIWFLFYMLEGWHDLILGPLDPHKKKGHNMNVRPTNAHV